MKRLKTIVKKTNLSDRAHGQLFREGLLIEFMNSDRKYFIDKEIHFPEEMDRLTILDLSVIVLAGLPERIEHHENNTSQSSLKEGIHLDTIIFDYGDYNTISFDEVFKDNVCLISGGEVSITTNKIDNYYFQWKLTERIKL